MLSGAVSSAVTARLQSEGGSGTVVLIQEQAAESILLSSAVFGKILPQLPHK